MIDNTQVEKLAFPSALNSAICHNNDKENHHNLSRLRRPLKCNRMTLRNKANIVTAKQERRHDSQMPSITREVETESEKGKEIIGYSGNSEAIGQDFPLACLRSSLVPINKSCRNKVEEKEDGNSSKNNNNNNKTHLTYKNKSKSESGNFFISQEERDEEEEKKRKRQLEIVSTKVLVTCNESHKSKSKKFYRTRQSMTNCRRKSAFFSKQKQKCQHHYKQQTSSIHLMIIKLILLLFVLLSTIKFHFSLGSGDHVLGQQIRFNERQQTLAAQVTGSSNSNSNNNSIISNNNDTNINNIVLNHSSLLKSTENSILVYEGSHENLELIKRQAEDVINEPASSTAELQAEARANNGQDETNNNNNNEDEIDSSSDSDKSTQIPSEQIVTATATATATNTTTTPGPSTGKKALSSLWSSSSTFSSSSSSIKRSVPVFRVTENELLPFSDFVVQQPAFSDLMKSWPPTTQQSTSPNYYASSSSPSSQSSAYSKASNAHLQASRLRHSRQHYGANWQHGGPNNRRANIELDELEMVRQMRNHLNEDLDDTIITADQSFDQDQLPEPPTWINYLGELGDFIYQQLRQYLERSLVGSSSLNKNKATDRRRDTVMGDQTNNDQDNNDSSQYEQQQQQQQQQQQAQRQQFKIETIDELLDDYYYDQYENSQVLYYGSQLVREGDIFEIGCYLPSDQSAEWTKSGRPLAGKGRVDSGVSSSPRVIRRSDFLGAKQNFSLKVFEASLSDSGNYRCNKMSRKYHKLVVVPLKTTTTQLYLIQQRLLSIVNPSAVSMNGLSVGSRFSAIGLGMVAPNSLSQRYQTSASGNQAQYYSANNGRNSNQTKQRYAITSDYTMLPGYLIVENQPLVVNCNITDEFVLRRLRENSQFQLSWYKNSRLLRGSSSSSSSSSNNNNNNNNNNNHYTSNSVSNSGYVLPSSSTAAASNGNQSPLVSSQSRGGSSVSTMRNNRLQLQQVGGTYASRNTNLFGATNQRIQYLQPNGRQLYITSAMYSDAGEYLCSWSNLPARNQPADLDGDGNELIGGQNQQTPSTISNNFLSAGNLVQLMAPVKLRPFKSTYHVRQGNELRLVCFAQRGYPAAHISWYVGNRLVDGDFLKEHPNEFRILNFQNQNQIIGTYLFTTNTNGDYNSNQAVSSSASVSNTNSPQLTNYVDKKKIVEINPIPLNRQQMQLTANGRGSWVEYRDFKNEKYAIESGEQQVKYLKQKLAQLMGQSVSSSLSSNNSDEDLLLATQTTYSAASEHSFSSYLSALQTSVSVLVINSLNIDKHTSRYACRATTRANTDEVTTVIRVQASSTIPVRPSTGRATLIPGQPLHFQCETVGNKNAQFIWYRKPLNDDRDELLEPNNDDNIEIHNDRLTLNRPTNQNVGDYYCRALKEDKSSTYPNEFAVIKVRMQPYIEDFGLDTSHTGKSSVITDGDRLELTCTVRDRSAPVNITWLRSTTPDDEKTMVPLPETPPTSVVMNFPASPFSSTNLNDPFGQTFTAPDQNIAITSVNSHSKKLVIDSIRHEHRSYYVCMVDNGITERSRKIIFIRVKDKLVALWPFLGILAELFILFTIIHVWETQRAYKEIHATPPSLTAGALASSSNVGKRPATGTSAAFENVPLTSG